MRRSILLSAGFIPLLVGCVLTLGESENLADRLVQNFSPDFSQGLGGVRVKPKLRINIEPVESMFSRASVEAAPDTIQTAFFSKPKVQTYSLSENALPFNRDFVESGSLKVYGALDPTQYVRALPQAPLVEDVEVLDTNYFGAANPNLFAQVYDGPRLLKYWSGPRDGARTPLRSAVEKRPDPNIARLYRARAQVKALAELRIKYFKNHRTVFKQARQNPEHKDGQHTEQLEESLTKSKNKKLESYSTFVQKRNVAETLLNNTIAFI